MIPNKYCVQCGSPVCLDLNHSNYEGNKMATDTTLTIVKTPEQLEAEKKQAYADLREWIVQADILKKAKDKEMELRNKVVTYFFPDGLREGANNMDLPDGWKLSVTGTINRKIDVAVEQAVRKEIAEKFHLDAGEWIKYKPELDVPAYRLLQKAVAGSSGEAQAEAKAILSTFEQMLIITDGSPQVELKQPKKPAAKKVAVIG